MFDYISGRVASVGENRLVIDCGGVGFALTATASACSEFAGKTNAEVPVYLAVREDALELFGFSSRREREMFLLLITVSGVGAKLAVTLLSGISCDRIASAVASSDVSALSAVKGVGKKTAERIVLELKNKIEQFGVVSTGGGMPAANQLDKDAVLLLMSLGMDKRDAEGAVARASKPGMATEDIVRAALKNN